MTGSQLRAPRQGGCRQLTKYLVFRSAGIVQRLAESAGQCVLLTFDDGPSAHSTPRVLDRLRQFNAQAVFFCIGERVRRFPSLVREVSLAGHRIGNHTDTHQPAGWLEVGRYFQEVQRCQDAIQAATGQAPELFRPPWGKTTPATLLAPRLLGLRSVYWSVDSYDHRIGSGAEAAAQGIALADAVTAGDIVLLHDNSPHILPLLDELLPRLIERGFDLRSGGASLS